MKAIILLALTLTVAQSSFLRNLDTVAIPDPTYTPDCFVSGTGGSLSAAATATGTTADLASIQSSMAAVFTDGTHNITASGVTIADQVKFTIAATIGTSHEVGKYYLLEVTNSDTTHTYTVPEKATSFFKVVTENEVASEGQTASQEVENGKTFEILFSADVTVVPTIYAANDASKTIADCSVAEGNAKKVVCKPTKDEVKEGDNEIYYQKGCSTTPLKTGVTVKFSDSPFVTLSKVALFVLAALL